MACAHAVLKNVLLRILLHPNKLLTRAKTEIARHSAQ